MSGSARDYFAAAPVGQPQQPLTGQTLALALMGHQPPPALKPPDFGGAGGSLLQQLMAQKGQPGQPGMLDQLGSGIGNILHGRSWAGVPGATEMAGLNTAAAANPMSGMSAAPAPTVLPGIY